MENLIKVDAEAWHAQKGTDDVAWKGVAALAPESLYEIPGYGSGTIVQYAMYVNLRQWGICSDNAVSLANSIDRNSRLLRAMGRVLAQIAAGGVTEHTPADVGDFVGIHSPVSPTILEFLADECGIERSKIVGAFSSESDRNGVLDLLQARIRKQTTDNGYRQSDLVVALGRADSYYGAACNIIKQIGKSELTTAMGLKG